MSRLRRPEELPEIRPSPRRVHSPARHAHSGAQHGLPRDPGKVLRGRGVSENNVTEGPTGRGQATGQHYGISKVQLLRKDVSLRVCAEAGHVSGRSAVLHLLLLHEP